MMYEKDYGTIDRATDPDDEDTGLTAAAKFAEAYSERHAEAERLYARMAEQMIRLLGPAVQLDAYGTAHPIILGLKRMLDELDEAEAAIRDLRHPSTHGVRPRTGRNPLPKPLTTFYDEVIRWINTRTYV